MFQLQCFFLKLVLTAPCEIFTVEELQKITWCRNHLVIAIWLSAWNSFELVSTFSATSLYLSNNQNELDKLPVHLKCSSIKSDLGHQQTNFCVRVWMDLNLRGETHPYWDSTEANGGISRGRVALRVDLVTSPSDPLNFCSCCRLKGRLGRLRVILVCL